FYSVDLRKLGQRQPLRLLQYCQQMLELVEQGVIRATVGTVLPFEQIQQAYRCLEERQNIGKVVVSVAGRYSPQLLRAAPALDAPAQSASAPVSPVREAIAVIGMSGRYGRANTVQELWEHLAAGTDLTEEVTRWDLSQLSERGALHGCHRGS